MSKKLLVIHPIDDYYGATRILANTIDSISEKYEVVVWVKENRNILANLLSKNDVSIIEVPTIPVIHSKMINFHEMWIFLSDLAKFCKFSFKMGSGISCVFINTFAGIPAILPFSLMNKRKIVHCHEAQSHRKLGVLLAKFSHIFADKILCVSNVVKKYVTTNKPSEKAVVLWNGISSDLPECKDEQLFSKNYFNIILVARVTKEKGYWFLAEALSRLPKDFRKRLRIHSFGDAPPNKPETIIELSNYLKEKGLDDVFLLHGFSESACSYMAKADLVIVPSMMVDPFPTTVLEGMRAKKVVLSTNHGGANEIISHGINGLLCQPGDVQGLSSLVKEILENKFDLDSIGKNGHLMFENELTIESYKDRLMNELDKELS